MIREAWAAAPGGGDGGPIPAIVLTLNIMPIGVAWKESTSNGPHPPPPNRRAVIAEKRESAQDCSSIIMQG